MSNRNDFTNNNTKFTGVQGIKIPAGTTGQRGDTPEVGTLRYNSTLGFTEQYNADGWSGIAPPPLVTTISPTSFNGESGTTITVNGSNFDTTASVQFILPGAVSVSAAVTTRVSSSQLTATIPRDFLASESPAGVRVTNGSGLTSILETALTFADVPLFATAAGSIGIIYDGSRSSLGQLSTLSATDSGGGSIVTYAIVANALPSGLSFNTGTAGISGTASSVASDTTSTFTVRATDNAGNTTDRTFSITVRAPVVQSFTSIGTTTFSVPTGVNNARVLVIAGGGGGGTRNSGYASGGTDGGSGGGAGGMIDHPAFPLTPGGSVTVTVGSGAPSNFSPTQSPGSQGGPSVFSSLTAIGGGFGGCGPLSPNPGGPGGSGGGEGSGGGTPGGVDARGVGVQPAQPGDSGTFGYGFPGGDCAPVVMPYTGAGGGGGSSRGLDGSSGRTGQGGSGRSSDVTGSAVTRAGGGGGGSHVNTDVGNNSGPGGGGSGGGNGNTNGSPGSSNTGGGGAGGPGGAGSGGAGGSGGPGVVIIRY